MPPPSWNQRAIGFVRAEDSNQQENRTNTDGGVVNRQPHHVVLGRA
ncbi:hypothetical protein [Pseudarthrobacter sp. NBSH8]|nr:hypothetical protein [Pseudarthrobacter sp. NBSH8]